MRTMYRLEVLYCSVALVDRVMKWSKFDETKTITGSWEPVNSLPVTVTIVPPACGPYSGQTSLTTGPTSFNSTQYPCIKPSVRFNNRVTLLWKKPRIPLQLQEMLTKEWLPSHILRVYYNCTSALWKQVMCGTEHLTKGASWCIVQMCKIHCAQKTSTSSFFN